MTLPVKHSLRFRLTTLIAALMLCVVVGLVSVAWMQARSSAEAVARSRLVSVTGQLGDLFTGSTDQGIERMSGVARAPALRAFTEDPVAAARATVLDSLRALATTTSSTTAALVSPDGERLLAAGDTAIGRDLGQLLAAIDSTGVTPLSTRGDTITYAMVAPVIDSTGSVRAYLVHWRFMKSTEEGLESLHDLIGGDADLFIGNLDGSVWTNMLEAVDGPTIPAQALTQPRSYTATSGDKRLGMVAPIGGSPWQVLVELSYDHVMAPVRVFLWRMIGLGSAFLLAGCAAAWLTAGWITRPVEDLTRAVSAISEGDHSLRVATERRDELGALSRGFDEMSDRVLQAQRGLEATVATRTHELTETLDRLRNSERLLFQFFEALSIGIFVVERDGHVYYRNSAALEILGADAHSGADGPSLPSLRRSRDDGSHEPYPPAECPLAVALRGSPAHVEDAVIGREGRSIPLEIRAVPVYDAHDEIAYAIAAFSDITERRAAEGATHRARELAEASNRAKSEFLAKMSHELRTPLNSIIGFSEILLDQTFGPLNEKQGKHVGNVHTSGKQLLRLINEVLDLSKVEAGRIELTREPVAIAPLLADVHAMVGALASRKRLSLVVDAPSDLREIGADPVRLRQILVNLVGNAIKFTPEDGEVRVTVREVGEDARGAAGMEFAVADNGIGIDATDQERIFEEFEQVKSAATSTESGTGLGLTLTRRFVELHGGRMRLESEPGRGSTFAFRLPFREEATTMVADVPTVGDSAGAEEVAEAVGAVEAIVPHPAKSEGGPLVLVVEDDDRAAELLTHHLTETGYRVSRAATSDQAVALAQTLRPDAITLDMFLPDGHGNQVLARLAKSERTSSIPVVVVSVSNDSELGMALGAREWIVKPASRDELVAAVDEVVTASPPVARSVLVVDDNPAIRELMTDLLQSRGYEVHAAEDGRRAIELANAETPDLVLLDLVMPGVSGFKVIDELRDWRQRTGARIVVFSDLDLTREQVVHLRKDVQGVVSKGDGRSALLRELARVTPSGRSLGNGGHASSTAVGAPAQELAP